MPTRSSAELTWRANEWVWWRACVDTYRQDAAAARQQRLERELAEVVGALASMMGYPTYRGELRGKWKR